MSNKQIEQFVNNEIALEDSHPRGEKPKYLVRLLNKMDQFTFGLAKRKHAYILQLIKLLLLLLVLILTIKKL